MKRITGAVCFAVTACLLILFAGSAQAANGYLPWLDFGSTLIWNSNTNTLLNDSVTQVNQVTYIDGSSATPTAPFPPVDPVLGVFDNIPPYDFYYSNPLSHESEESE